MPCIKLSSGKTVCHGEDTNMYPNGGKTEDRAFKKFVSTLPPNLKNTGSDYNLRGYWESLGKPSAFDYSQPKEKDGKYHAYSRNSETGEILKRPNHPTFGQALEEDRKLGYYPYQSPSGVIHTFKPNEVPQGFNVPIYPIPPFPINDNPKKIITLPGVDIITHPNNTPINKNKPIVYKGVDINAKPWMKDNDSWFENIVEIVDPTGLSSWDDVRRAGNNYGYNSPEFYIEAAGAVPFLGKAGKMAKGLSHLAQTTRQAKNIKNFIRGINTISLGGTSKDTYDAATSSKDDSGFKGGFGSNEPLQYDGRNVFPDLSSEYSYSQGGTIFFNHEPVHFPDGGKTTFNFPVSKERQLAEQARAQGDMPVAPGIVKAQEKLREQEAVKKKLANQPTVKLSAAQKKDIDAQGLKQDALAEMMRRNQQSLSNPDDRSIEADIAQDLNENGAMGLLDAPIKGYMALRTGRYQSPSQAIGRWANESGHQMLRNAMIDDQFNPTGLGMVTDWGGPIALEMAASKAVQAAPKVLKNAYKINPWAVKENPEMFLYRTQPKNFVPGLTEEQVLKNEIANKISKGEQVPWWLTGKLNKIQNSPEPFREALNTYHGQWFDRNPARMDFYMKGRLDNEVGDILRLKVPKNVGDSYNLKNFPEAQKASLNYDTEFIVPRQRLGEAEQFSTEDLQKLIDEDKAFNTPHWLKGYQEINGPSKGVISNRLLSNFDPRNLKSKPALDWVKQWHSHPDFVNRYSNNKNLFIGGAERFQKDVLGALDRYQPKNYIDLLKDKGLEDFIEYKLRSQGVSYGTPNNIYVNRTSFFPFNKIGKESVTGHELSHLTDINGLAFTPEDKEALLKPFGYSRSQYYKKFPTNKHRKKGEGYYLDPTEIRARMTQGRMKFDLMPNDKFTPKMFDEMLQSNNWEGMGNYIKDKKGFLDLINNFWAVPATTVGVGAAAKSVGAEEPVQKDGGKNNKTIRLSTGKIVTLK
jgi:hypothetical protein